MPTSSSVQTLAVAIVTGAIATVVVVVCLVACRQRHTERRLRRHALKQEARHAEGADLLGLGTFDWSAVNTKGCSADDAAAPRGSEFHGGPLLQPRVSDHHDPLSQPNDSEYHEPSLFETKAGSHIVASKFDAGGGSESHGPNSAPGGPGYHWPQTESRGWSNFPGTKLESNIYEKVPQKAWAPYDGVGKRWPPSSDGRSRFPSKASPFITDDDLARSTPHQNLTSADPSNAGLEDRWGHTGSRTLPLSHLHDGLEPDSTALPRTTSGPDVIVGYRSLGTRKWSLTGRDRDAILEPITVAGETTFPVYPEVTSAARLREPPSGGAFLESCGESDAKCDFGMLHTKTFTSDASGESVSRVCHTVSKRCHGDEVEASGADLWITPSGDRRINEAERRERTSCCKDDRTRKSGK